MALSKKSFSEVVDTSNGDLELARGIERNVPGALENLIERHGDHLRRLISNLSNGSASTDDLLQETLLKVWEAAGSYRGDAPVRHWLTQIAVRVCRNHQRSYRRWTVHLKSFWQQRTERRNSDSFCDKPDNDAMHRAMNQLSYSDRELLVLYYFEEQSLSQLAVELGIRENTIHVRLHRSRERLKALLKQAEDNK